MLVTITAPPKLNFPEGHQFRATGIMVTPLQSVTFAVITGTVTTNAPATGILPTTARQHSSALQNTFVSLSPIFPGKEEKYPDL